jgi:hypothetical protein
MNRERLSDVARLRVAASQGYRCRLCGDMLPGDFEVDHRIALSLFGSNNTSNLQCICSNCHSFKTKEDVRRVACMRRGELTVFCGGCGDTYSIFFLHQHVDCICVPSVNMDSIEDACGELGATVGQDVGEYIGNKFGDAQEGGVIGEEAGKLLGEVGGTVVQKYV